MLSKQPEIDPGGLLACLAELAGMVAQARVDDDVLPDSQLVVRDSAEVPDRVDDPGGVGAEDPGRDDLDARYSSHDEQIQMVERRRFDANTDLAAPGLWLRQIGAVL